MTGAHRGPDLQRRSSLGFVAGRVIGGASGPRGQNHEAGKRGRKDRAGADSVERNGLPFPAVSRAPPVPQGGCHGDRRPHVLGASFLVKGAHCSCVKPSSVCPSARDGGFGFTPRTKTQSPPCCVEVHGAQRPSQAFKCGAGGQAAAITLANQPTEANTRVWKNS